MYGDHRGIRVPLILAFPERLRHLLVGCEDLTAFINITEGRKRVTALFPPGDIDRLEFCSGLATVLETVGESVIGLGTDLSETDLSLCTVDLEGFRINKRARMVIITKKMDQKRGELFIPRYPRIRDQTEPTEYQIPA